MNKVTVKKLPKSKIEVLVEVPADDFDLKIVKALDELTKEAEIEGFRKGTAPKELVAARFGEGKIMERASKMAVEETYPAAISENKLEPLGYPEVEILKLAKGNPFEYKFIVSVFPEVLLGDYKEAAKTIKFKEPEVSEEDIKRLKMEKEHHEKEHLREDLMAKLREAAKIEVPESMVERETERVMEDLRKKTPQALNMSFDEYLKKIKKTEQELRDSLSEDNEQKIKNYLILQEIAKLEKIDPTEKEIMDVIEKVTQGEAKENLDFDHLKEYYKDVVKNEKVFDFLEGLFKKA
jgi:FKBP-type peptidyl-prolyl cis-trans isomerase (trigger factor)